jgi:O-antigen ligase
MEASDGESTTRESIKIVPIPLRKQLIPIRTVVVAGPTAGLSASASGVQLTLQQAHRTRLLRAATSIVLVALVFAAVTHGAFYSNELRATLGLLLVALASTVAGQSFSRREIDVPIIAAAALGAWYAVAALVRHDLGGAAPALELLVALSSVIVIVRRADRAERRVVVDGLLAVGLLVAITGWYGVVWHRTPLSLVDGGLWRAASTITYANATGGLLAALTIVALGVVITDESHRRLSSLVAFVMMVGLFATLSRAALIAFAVGFVVVAVLTAGRVLATAIPIVIGAIVATCGLLPSMPAAGRSHPMLALAALVVGGVLVLLPFRALAICIACLAVSFAAIPALRSPFAEPFRTVRGDRVELSSPDRAHEAHAAIELARAHPLFGVGPGRVDLTWTGAWLATMHVAYAHDEYLQVVDEAGAVGGVIVLLGLGAIGLGLWRVLRTLDNGIVFACIGALVALGVHSSMDFLWHIPLIPMVGATLVALLFPPTRTRRVELDSQEGNS